MVMISFWSKTVERIRNLARRSRLFCWTLRMATLLTVLGVGGLLVAISGIMPIKASSGHWAITHFFLEFSKERSVATHTMGITPPPLDDPVLILKGAGHYEMGCRSCHGSPELHHPRIAQRMLPHPPYLPETAPKWQPEELFYMVKHGIMFTGMPAWPSPQRDDEVWAMVAFLRVFPELDAEEYHRLVNGAAARSPEGATVADPDPALEAGSLIKSCNPCHGAKGQGREVGAFPKLAGQRPEYFIASMEAFARGERHSGNMEPIAAGISSKQLRDLARHYAKLKSSASPSKATQKSIQRGEDIARRGIPQQKVPACADCHDSKGSPMNPLYPALDGQHADYLILQLTLFKQGNRGGTSYAHLMHNVVAGMSVDDIRDVASYFASRNRTVP